MRSDLAGDHVAAAAASHRRPSVNAVRAPENSITISAPRPAVRSRTTWILASGSLCWATDTVSVAPQSLARSSLDVGSPTTMIRPAPEWVATAVANSPSGPEPWMTIVSQGSMAPNRSNEVMTVRSAQLAAEAHSGFSCGAP